MMNTMMLKDNMARVQWTNAGIPNVTKSENWLNVAENECPTHVN